MSEDTAPGVVTRVKDGAMNRWQRLQDSNAWLRHTLRAYALLNDNNGNQYAAAITYFSFVALFPLLLLAVAVAGFVLSSQPDTLNSLFDKITQSVPGSFGTTLKDSIRQAIDARAGVGIVGLVGVLLTGLGWIGNLRQAIDGVWGRRPAKQNFVMSKVTNLIVLAGLGIGILVSLALTAAGTSVTSQLLRLLHLDGIPGTTVLLKVVGIAIAVAGDMVIFWWVLVRLPQAQLDRGSVLRGTLLASIGFEILKIVGTYTIAHAGTSKTAGPFVSVIAILAWIYLVSRWLMFCCAWLASGAAARRNAESDPAAALSAVAGARSGAASGAVGDAPSITPAAVGATLVGAGAIAGAVATWAVTRPRPDQR